jgi:hypothetical protein
MGWRKREDEEEVKEEPPKIPTEPNGKALTQKRRQLDDTYSKMAKVAEEITRLLQDEQRRQDKYNKGV